jgi:hypothetical protein
MLTNRSSSNSEGAPLRHAATVASEPSSEPSDVLTGADLLAVVRDTCGSLDPPNTGFYQHMTATDVRDALRINALLLEATRTYQHKYRIDRRGRRPFASALYRHLDITPPAYTVIALAWSSLTTALLSPPDPEPADTTAADGLAG